jgi:hypothetical protein
MIFRPLRPDRRCLPEAAIGFAAGAGGVHDRGLKPDFPAGGPGLPHCLEALHAVAAGA